jgi:ATPase subunit of ABC transporter with duplicated ATPase domains
METANPSHGELRKIYLGLGLLKKPYFIVMDEPTNHLDHPSIVCLEQALQEFQGALLLVSHDIVFINKLAKNSWTITTTTGKNILNKKAY